MGEVHVRAWQVAYRGLMPDAYLDGLAPEERAAMWHRNIGNPRSQTRIIVAERGGSVDGFAVIGPRGDAPSDGDEGELYALNVDPDRWDRGLGRALLDAVHDGLAELGFKDAILWVHPENQRARRFYAKAGWRYDNASRDAEVLGVVVPEVRYRRALLGQTAAVETMAATPRRLAAAAAAVGPVAIGRAPAQGEWSIADVIGHVRAADAIVSPRIIQLLVRDDPPVITFDERAWQRVVARAAVAPLDALDLLGRQRAELVALLRTLAPEEWARSSLHPEHGRMSVAAIVAMIAAHEDEHCRQAADIAAGQASQP
jgi:ribosomal protein S18 acetylase RimI-like enzyme